MKVLILDTIKPLGQSSTVHIWEFIKSLSKLGQEVHVMTISDKIFGEVVFHSLIKKKTKHIRYICVSITLLNANWKAN